MDEKNEKTNGLEMAIGGSNFMATRKDGTTEQVFIREFTIRMSNDATAALEDDLKMAILATGMSETWLDNLKATSFTALLDAIYEVNADFFDGCMRRSARRIQNQERLMPGLRDSLVQKAMEKLRSQMDQEQQKASVNSVPASAP